MLGDNPGVPSMVPVLPKREGPDCHLHPLETAEVV